MATIGQAFAAKLVGSSSFLREHKMNPRRTATMLCSLAAMGALCAMPLHGAVPEAYQPNYDAAYNFAYPIGNKLGLADGKQRGILEGTENGTIDGYDAGWDKTYQPAFDRAYDERFPVGQAQGWNDGVGEGFEEGFNWAPTIAEQVFNNSLSGVVISNGNRTWSCCGPGSSSAGSLMITGLGFADYTVFRDPGPEYWAAHYYDVGYDDGHAQGFSDGSIKGYDLTYPRAYKAAYKIGFLDGSVEGKAEGALDGGEEGFDDGWHLGFGDGFDQGFIAGVEYHIFGQYFEPINNFVYTNFRSAGTSVPEPAALALMAMTITIGLLRRSR